MISFVGLEAILTSQVRLPTRLSPASSRRVYRLLQSTLSTSKFIVRRAVDAVPLINLPYSEQEHSRAFSTSDVDDRYVVKHSSTRLWADISLER